jgi:hypothetical protein
MIEIRLQRFVFWRGNLESLFLNVVDLDGGPFKPAARYTEDKGRTFLKG